MGSKTENTFKDIGYTLFHPGHEDSPVAKAFGNKGILGGLGGGLFGDTGNITAEGMATPTLSASITGAGQGTVQGFREQARQQAMGLGQLGMDRAMRSRQAPVAFAADPGQAARINQGGVNFSLRGDLGAGQRQQQFTDDDLLAAARGEAPSAAAVQQQQGVEAALKAQLAAAASARGGAAERARAQQQAAVQGARMQQGAIGDAAQLRAQEQAQARGMYMDSLGQQRAQNIQRGGLQAQLATSQAQLGQQMALQNLANMQQQRMLNPELALRSRQMDDQIGAQLLGLGLQANQQGGNLTLDQGKLTLDAQQALLDRDLEIAKINAGAEEKRNAGAMGILKSAGSMIGLG